MISLLVSFGLRSLLPFERCERNQLKSSQLGVKNSSLNLLSINVLGSLKEEGDGVVRNTSTHSITYNKILNILGISLPYSSMHKVWTIYSTSNVDEVRIS